MAEEKIRQEEPSTFTTKDIPSVSAGVVIHLFNSDLLVGVCSSASAMQMLVQCEV